MEIVFAAKSEALGDTLNIIDMNIFEQAVDILAGAGRIVQIALRDVLFVSVAIKKHESVKENLGKVKQSLIGKRY